MNTSKNSGKIALIALVALIVGAASFGYFQQTAKLDSDTPPAHAKESAAEKPAAVIDATLLEVKPTDIVIGDAKAAITLVEYSSLSCPHCAHFHEKIFPELDKNFISTGKVKLVVRHFPLNPSAIKGATTVECAGKNDLKRENFIKVLFDMQAQWAFGESFLKDLKQIALVGGLDSAAFDSCMADAEIEARILTSRQEAESKLGITATPAFFINGKKMTEEPSVEGFTAAIDAILPVAK